MNLNEASFLLAFNRWANDRILSAGDTLAPADFTRDLGSSFPSVRDTLVHVLWAEWLWLERCRGRSPQTVLDPAAFTRVAELRAGWAPVDEGLCDVIAHGAEADLKRIVSYTNRQGEQWSYPVTEVVRHLVNHSTFHRGQIVTMLRQLRVVPPVTDLLVFVDMGSPGLGPAGLP